MHVTFDYCGSQELRCAFARLTCRKPDFPVTSLKRRRGTLSSQTGVVLMDSGSTPIERMYFPWNDALARNDAEALLLPHSLPH